MEKENAGGKQWDIMIYKKIATILYAGFHWGLSLEQEMNVGAGADWEASLAAARAVWQL